MPRARSLLAAVALALAVPWAAAPTDDGAAARCPIAAGCEEDTNCPDVPRHAGRSHADLFGTECGTKVSKLWKGAPKTLLAKLCPVRALFR